MKEAGKPSEDGTTIQVIWWRNLEDWEVSHNRARP